MTQQHRTAELAESKKHRLDLHHATGHTERVRSDPYLELGADEVRPELSEKIRRVPVEIARPHGHEVVGSRVVGALLGAHEETIPLLSHQSGEE